MVVCFGEVLLRLAAERPELLFQSQHLHASFCGAETNVAVNLAGFGHECTIVTTLPDSSVGMAARRSIAAMGPRVSAPMAVAGRMGLFFLQPGAMTRPSLVTYDRAGSAFAEGDPEGYDWDNLLGEAGWLFVSGITAALGDGPLRALRKGIATARAIGVKVAFDTNYRPTLWRGREEEAARVLRELSCEADLIFAGRRATRLMTGRSCERDDPTDGFRVAVEAMFEIAPNLQHMAATRRTVNSSDRQDLTGLIADREGLAMCGPLELVGIVDRLGTGDAFAAGIMHGLLMGHGREEIIRFGVACAQWAHSIPGDFMRASIADIESLAGTGDVRR